MTVMKRRCAAGLILAAAFGVLPCGGVTTDRLAELQKPWDRPMERLSLGEYEAALRGFAAKHPGKARLELRGKTIRGYNLWLLTCTDRSVPDDDKNVIFVSTLHSGLERTGTVGVMAFADWLLGGSPEADEALKRNVVLLMPNNNPEAAYLTENHANSAAVDPYSGGRGALIDLETLRPKEPAKCPEILAFDAVSDEYAPDINVDVHGVWMDFDGHIQPATVGRAGSNSSILAWDDRIDQLMMRASARAGFCAGRPDADCERILWGPDMGAKWKSFCDIGLPFYYTATYGYLRNHTMICCIESTWTETVVEPLKALVMQASKGFSKGPVKDFRVNRIRGELELYVTACGRTKAERRASRVKLWRNQRFFSTGSSYPATANWTAGAVIYGPKAYADFIDGANDDSGWVNVRYSDLLARLDKFPYMDRAGLERFLSVHPPEADHFAIERGVFENGEIAPDTDSGMAALVRLPMADADILHVSLNGRLIGRSEDPEKGYLSWNENGYTCVSVTVPRERFAKEPVQIVGVAWNPPKGVKRHYGWHPTPELAQAGAAAKAAERTENIINVSWGDQIIIGPGLYTLDTPQRIATALRRWKDVFDIKTVVWRLDDELFQENYEFRVTVPWHETYRQKTAEVSKLCDPVRTAQSEARKNGQQFLLYQTFLDHGASTNVLFGGDTPFPFQDRQTIAHPDYQERDLAGNWHDGVLDLSNPDARKMMVDRISGFVRRYDAVGTYVCNRSHSKPAEHADQFGFGPYTVAAYRERYGIDITKDKRFDWRSPEFAPQSPEVENWRRLRGEFLVQFYRELRAAMPGKVLYLGLPRGPYIGAPYGNLYVDTERIVRERLADGIVVNLYSGRNLYPADKTPHRERGYLMSYDDNFNAPDKRECLNALLPLCRSNGVKVFYVAHRLEEGSADGAMLSFAFPRKAKVEIWDEAGLTTRGRLTVNGWFKLAETQGYGAPRLVCKYGHDLDAERGWEILLDEGKPKFHARIVQPGGTVSEIYFGAEMDFPKDKWTRLTVDYIGPNGKAIIALDGKTVATTTFPAGSRLFDNRDVPILLGCYENGSLKADMAVDELSFSGNDGKPFLTFSCEGKDELTSVCAESIRVDVRGQVELIPGPNGKALSFLGDESDVR